MNAVTVSKMISVSSITDALFGTWSGSFHYNLSISDNGTGNSGMGNKPNVVPVAGYYSSLEKAIYDVNNSDYSMSSSDANEETAKVYVHYVEEDTYYDGLQMVPYIDILADIEVHSTLYLTKNATINIGSCYECGIDNDENIYITSYGAFLIVDGCEVDINGFSSSIGLKVFTDGSIQTNAISVINNGELTIDCFGLFMHSNNYSDTNPDYMLYTANGGRIYYYHGHLDAIEGSAPFEADFMADSSCWIYFSRTTVFDEYYDI